MGDTQKVKNNSAEIKSDYSLHRESNPGVSWREESHRGGDGAQCPLGLLPSVGFCDWSVVQTEFRPTVNGQSRDPRLGGANAHRQTGGETI